MESLRVALLGLHGVGVEYLTAIQSNDLFTLTAVAEADGELLRQHTEAKPLSTFQDYRSAIVEMARAGLDLLFVALEPFQSIDYIEMAAEHGIGVFHKAPFARSSAEARRLIGRFEEAGRPLIVSRPWQFEPAYDSLTHRAEVLGRVHAAAAEVRTSDGSEGWRGDSVRAAGGVLLNGAYEQLDMLVHLMGLPEYVDAQCSAAVPPGKTSNYDTEDAVQLSLRLTGKRIASLTASRKAAASHWHVALIGEHGSIDLSEDRSRFQPADGRRARSRRVRTTCRAQPAINAFGAALSAGDEKLPSTAAEHLPTTAVVEAAYLSVRTGTAESPSQFLDD